MPVLRFTLSEEGVGALREALACLNKFSDEVSLESKRDKLIFTSLNSTKSAYGSFSFSSNRFFSRYQYDGTAQSRDKFYCKLYNRALLSLFRARLGDPLHVNDRDATIDHCDVKVVDEVGKKSRFIVKITCRNGMITKYRLPFEVSPPVHAKFDKTEAVNHWSITSRTLRQLMDHFGPGIEFLDIHSEDEQVVNFTCFTEKVAAGDEVLKKPLHTSIAVERDEFGDFEVEEDNLHIVVSVKDFRAIIQHAAFLGSEISASYSAPSRPMQIAYNGDGLKCEFLLMTVGERGAPGQRTKKTKANARASRQEQLEGTASRANSHAPAPAPLPPLAARRQAPMPSLRPQMPRQSQRVPPPAYEAESLFVPQENDEQWEPVNVNEDEDEEDNGRLKWDASANPNPSAMNMRTFVPQKSMAPGSASASADGNAADQNPPPSGIEPTQRLSDVRKFGLFGE